MPDTYRVGIIGHSGRGNYGHGLDSVWGDVPQTKVVAVADPDEGGRLRCQSKTGAEHVFADYRQMLEEVELDIVAVAPRWLDQHHAMILAAVDAGCHVYTEKPFCRDLVEADEIVQACEMRHAKLAIAHQTRWSPTLERVRKEIRGGLIGRVLELRGRGKEDPRRGGGEDLWVLGSHVLDLMRYFSGDPVSCSARVTLDGEPIDAGDVYDGNEGIGPLAGDTVHARYRFPGTVTGDFASVRGASGRPSRFGLQIFGSEGIVEVYTGHLAPCYVLQDSSWSPGRSGKSWVPFTSNGLGEPETRGRSSLHGGNVAAINDLIDCIENPEKQPQCSVYDARWTVEMIAAVFESQRVGAEVSLPLSTRQNPLSVLVSETR